MIKSFVIKAVLLLHALFLFYFNADQVAAEGLNDGFIEQTTVEVTSEEDASVTEPEVLETSELIDDEEADPKEEPPSMYEDGGKETSPDEEVLLSETAQEDENPLESTDGTDNEEEVEMSDERAESVKSEGSEQERPEEEGIKVDTLVENEEIEEQTPENEEKTSVKEDSEEPAVEDTEEPQTPYEEVEENEGREAEDEKRTVLFNQSFSAQTAALPMAASVASERDEEDAVDRIAGANRYANAVEISKAGWTEASTVVIANGEKFADSLTGSALASVYNAPILLTKSGHLPKETLEEVKRLNPNEVVVLGGTLSISDSILDSLQTSGFQTRRIAGQNRYILAENIAKEVMAAEGLHRDAFLVNGEIFSDAMSIAPVAASKRLPIFLTKGHTLHQTVINAIPYVNSWTIIGGRLTIFPSVESEMQSLGAETKRIDGKNRYEVNRNVIQYYGTPGNHMYVASGEHFSDALPASALAAKEGSAVLLVRDNNQANLKEQKEFAKEKNTERFTLIGGPLTLSKATEDYFNRTPYVIYLDPGHGGWESGASYHGVNEKDLNLSVSKKISQILGNRGYEVLMSRTTDRYVGLYERADDANRSDADIFVSVHHNAMPNGSSVSGIENFYYKYDYDDYYKPRNPGSATYRKATSQDRGAESLKLANAIHGELIQDTGANNRGVKEMSFAVIRETTMPAVLLELGFMSNWAELSKLITDSYQNLLAHSVADGIDRYFA